MEFIQQIRRSLKSARTVQLPEDPKAAAYVLTSMVIANQYRSVAELLASSSLDVNRPMGKARRNFLQVAANCGSYECLCLLLKQGADIHHRDISGCTALHLAARNGQKKCMEKLLKHKADVNIGNNEGLTALHLLAANGRTELLQELLPYVPDVDVGDGHGQTALHVASQNGHKTTVRCLLDHNADVNRQNCEGSTSLAFACKHGQWAIVQILLASGAKYLSDNNGVSPLQLSVQGGYTESCSILLQQMPFLFDQLMEMVFRADVMDSQLLTVMMHVIKVREEFKFKMLSCLAEMLTNVGLKLLSVSSDFQQQVESFLHGVRIFCNLNHSLHQLSSAEQNDETMAQIGALVQSTNVLWDSLEHWMVLLVAEIHNMSDAADLRDSACALCQLQSGSSLNTQVTTVEVKSESEHCSLNIEDQSAISPETLQKSSVEDDATTTSASETSAPKLDFREARNSDSSSGRAQDRTEVTVKSDGSLKTSLKCDDIQSSTEDAPMARLATSAPVSDSSMVQKISNPSDSLLHDNHQPNDISHERTVSSSWNRNACRCSKEMNSHEDIIDKIALRLCAIIKGYHMYCKCRTHQKVSQFLEFVDRHEKVMKYFVERNPAIIFEYFAFILDYPELMYKFMHTVRQQPFATRKKWFYEHLHPLDGVQGARYAEQVDVTLKVKRDALFHSSCKALREANKEELMKGLSVRFEGEEGMGQGVVREWFDILSNEILNPDYALFSPSSDGATFQPNSNSAINPDHLAYFKFAGEALSLALYHQQVLNVSFTRSFYKHILGIPVDYKDVAFLDPEYAKNLQWILDHDITDLELDLTFCVETDVFGQMQEVELKEGGRQIPVTEENKHEYVQCVTELRMTRAIQKQIDSFLEGFHTFIPPSLVQLFDYFDLEMLLSGPPTVDLEEWKRHTEYNNCSEDTELIKWFWETVEEFNVEDRSRLLQFVTGRSRVPHNGWTDGVQKFVVSEVGHGVHLLPTASTCISLLKLPSYAEKQELKEKLLIAIRSGYQGYGMA